MCGESGLSILAVIGGFDGWRASARGPSGIAVGEFYLRSRNSQRNDEIRRLRTNVHSFRSILQMSLAMLGIDKVAVPHCWYT
jgi:hypothetical protein